MPIFGYKCENCGNEEEVICNYEDKPEFVKCSCRVGGVLPTLMAPVVSSGSFVMTGYRESNGYSVSEDIGNRKGHRG